MGNCIVGDLIEIGQEPLVVVGVCDESLFGRTIVAACPHGEILMVDKGIPVVCGGWLRVAQERLKSNPSGKGDFALKAFVSILEILVEHYQAEQPHAN